MELKGFDRPGFKNTITLPQAPTKPTRQGNFLTSLIPSGGGIAGAAGGAALGTAILPGVGTLAGALLGGALGGGAGKVAENAVEGNKLTSGVAGEAALNGVLGAGPLRLGKFGVDAIRGGLAAKAAGNSIADALANAGTNAANMSITKAVGNKLSKSGENLIAKEFRLNPTQQANFAKLHGEEATSVLRRYGVKSPEDVQAKIQPLQDAFDSAITDIPAVSKTDLEAGLKKVYQPLIKSPALFEQNLGNQIKAQADELLKLAGDKTVKTAAGKFDESSLRQLVGENIAQAAQSGGKSAKAITRSMLSGKSKDAYSIVMNAFAQSPNKAEISDLVTKVAPQLEGNEKNRLVKDLVDIKDPQEAANRIWDALGSKTSTLEGSIPADKVNDLRKTFDSAVNYTQKGAPEYNVIKKTADALRGTLQAAADKAGVKTPEGLSFKEVGKELRKLYGLDDIVGKQAYLGTGSLPANLPALLGAGAGGSLGGPAGGALGMAGTILLNSNAGRRAITNGTLKAGEKLTEKAAKSAGDSFSAKNIAKRIAPVGLAQALGSNYLSDGKNTQPNTAMSMNSSNQPITANISPLNQTNDNLSSTLSAANDPFSVENIQANVQKLLQSGANVKDIQSYLDIAGTMQQIQAAAAKTSPALNATQQQQANNAASGLSDLQTLAQEIQNDPSVLVKDAIPGGGIARRLTGTSNYEAAKQNVVDVIARLRSGAAITQDEANRYMGLLPGATDTPQIASQKLQRLYGLLSSFANPQPASANAADLATALGM